MLFGYVVVFCSLLRRFLVIRSTLPVSHLRFVPVLFFFVFLFLFFFLAYAFVYLLFIVVVLQ
jgi:hypothetical protein